MRQFSLKIVTSFLGILPLFFGAHGKVLANPTIGSQSDRTVCVNWIIKNRPDLGVLARMDSAAFALIPECAFDEFSDVKVLNSYLNKLEFGPTPEDRIKFSETDFWVKGPERERAELSLSDVTSASIAAAVDLINMADSNQLPIDFVAYPQEVIRVAGEMSLLTLASGYDHEAYKLPSGDVRQSYFRFYPHSKEALPDIEDEFRLNAILGDKDDIRDCRDSSACPAYLETLLLSRVWYALWAEHSVAAIQSLLKRIDDSLAEYDNFFFESGDGLYPWELWVNSRGKKDDIFSVPKSKWNVLHPTPIVYIDGNSAEVDPSIMVEVLGYTRLNYSKNPDRASLPIGIALGVDVENDRVRYGPVVHLPIKGMFNRVGLDTMADIVPCTLCSVSVLTDGSGEWEVGLKIDVARLLYSKDKAKKTFVDFLK